MAKAIGITLILMILLLLAPASLVAADDGEPMLPHQFYGTVQVRSTSGGANLDAPVGRVVRALVDGVEKGRFIVTEAGKYGGPDVDDLKLLVQDVPGEGNLIEFYIDNCKADQTAEYHSGAITELNLTAYCPAAGGGGGGGPGRRPPRLDVDMWGKVSSGSMTEDGVLTETVVATSEDGNVSMTLEEGTKALDCEGDPLDRITVEPIEPPPPSPPPDGYIIAAYDFEPCATFVPPVSLTVRYDDEALPEGVSEEGLVLAYYDEDTGEWVVLPGVVDTAANTVTASISHTTVFAILGAVLPPEFTLANLVISPREVSSGEDVTISVVVTNTGGSTGSRTVELRIDGALVATEEVTLAPGASDTVAFTVARDEAGTYGVTVKVEDKSLSGSFTVTAAPFPWWIVGVGLGLAIMLAAAITFYLLVWRRRRAAA